MWPFISTSMFCILFGNECLLFPFAVVLGFPVARWECELPRCSPGRLHQSQPHCQIACRLLPLLSSHGLLASSLLMAFCLWGVSLCSLTCEVSHRKLESRQALISLCLLGPFGFPWGSCEFPPWLLSLVLQPKSQRLSFQVFLLT